MSDKIFAGLKVADFTWAAAGPIVTRHLADNGATVIKVESFKHPDSIRLGGPFTDEKPGINRSGFFADFHSSKRGIAVDMGHPRAKEIIEPLIQWADVVADSFRPGIMDKWGFGYARIKELNPSAVVFSSSLYGAEGPWAKHPGYGAQGQALAGIHWLTGWPDRPPAMPKGAYSDSVSPRYGTAALVAALIHRARTGEGQHVELSQIETTVQLLTPQIVEYQATGNERGRTGGALEGTILHGSYPCDGDERWIVIEVDTEAQWQAFKDTVGEADRLEAARAAGTLDEAVAEWTKPQDPHALMATLRAAGVPAGVAFKGSDLLADPVLRARGHFWPLEHAEMGTLEYNGPAYRFSKTPSELTCAAPLLGQHTTEVLKDVLGFDDGAIDGFRDAGLLQ